MINFNFIQKNTVMKTLIILAYTMLFSGTLVKSQNNENRALDQFTGIEVKNGILVQLIKDEKESAEIKTQDIQTSQVITEIKNGLLLFRIDKPPLSKSKVVINLHYRELFSIKASGKSDISSTALIKQDSLIVELVSGAQAYLDLDVIYLKSNITEGAMFSAEGYAIFQEASAATGATLSLFDLESDEVIIKVSSNGKAKINVEKNLTADASTGGYISFKGNPKVKNIKTSVGGKVEQNVE